MEQWSHPRNGAHNNDKDKSRKLFPSIGRLVTRFGSHKSNAKLSRIINVFELLEISSTEKLDF